MQTLKNKIFDLNFSDVLSKAREHQNEAKTHGLVNFGPKLGTNNSRVTSKEDILLEDSEEDIESLTKPSVENVNL